MRNLWFIGWCVATFLPAFAAAEDAFQSTASGDQGAVPNRYAPPLISNGGLCLLVDYQGCQFQRHHTGMMPGLWWAGRRYGPPNDQLIPFGHFEQELAVDGK